METIHDRIVRHKELYQNAGLEVPPYRLTRMENILLKNHLADDKSFEHCIITSYHGVTIEPCVLLKDY